MIANANLFMTYNRQDNYIVLTSNPAGQSERVGAPHCMSEHSRCYHDLTNLSLRSQRTQHTICPMRLVRSSARMLPKSMDSITYMQWRLTRLGRCKRWWHNVSSLSISGFQITEYSIADQDSGMMGGMMQDLAFSIPGVDEAMGFAEIMKSVL